MEPDEAQLKEEIRRSTLHKAELLAQSRNPLELFAMDHPAFGIVLHETVKDIPDCRDDPGIDACVLALLTASAASQSMDNAKHAWRDACASLKKAEEELRQVQKEARLAGSAYKSAKAQNAWLNRENESGSKKQDSLQKKMDSLGQKIEDSRKKKEELTKRLAVIEQEIPGQKKLLDENEEAAGNCEEQARTKQGELSISDRLFHPGHVNEIRREAAALFVQADSFHINASRAASTMKQLQKEQQEHLLETQQLDQRIKDLENQLEECRKASLHQAESLHAGTIMTAEQDERTKELDRRVQKLQKNLARSQRQVQQAQNMQELAAHGMIHAFASSEDFRMILLNDGEDTESRRQRMLAILFAEDAVVLEDADEDPGAQIVH